MAVAQQQQEQPEWPKEVKWVYILCSPDKERARFERLVPHLVSRGIPKECLRVCAPTWADTLDNPLIFKVYDPFLKRGGLPTFCYKADRLSKGEISLVLNFFGAIQNAMKELKPDESILVFESDAYIRRDFVKRLRETLEAANKHGDWGAVSLGEGVGTRLPGSSKSYYAATQVGPAPNAFGFRCTDSMLFRAPLLENLCKTFLPFKESLDWELNFQTMLHTSKVLWVEPPLAEQGTTHGREDTFLK